MIIFLQFIPFLQDLPIWHTPINYIGVNVSVKNKIKLGDFHLFLPQPID